MRYGDPLRGLTRADVCKKTVVYDNSLMSIDNIDYMPLKRHIALNLMVNSLADNALSWRSGSNLG